MLNTIKATAKIAGFLLVVLLALGCGGPMQGPVANSNPPTAPPAPSASHASSKFLYVVNSIEKTVEGFAIDGATGALTAVGPAVAADDAPIYAAATPDGKFLYVANAGTKAIGVSAYRIDGLRGSLMATAPAEFATTGDSGPFGIVVDPTSTHVYTTNLHSISAFSIDPATGALSDVPGTPVSIPNTNILGTLAITADGKFLYAADIENNSLWEFTVTASGLPQRMGSVATGDYPVGVVVDPSGKFVYVANWRSNDVSLYTISPGSGALVASSSTMTMPDACNPQELAVSPASQLFASCAGTSMIARFAIDPMSGALSVPLPSFSTGDFTAPRGIAVDSSGSFLYSAWNMQNRAGATAIGRSGRLMPVAGAPLTGRGPIGVALSGSQ
jgi:DNA-binding beta-propeller fold protein YncE